MANPLSDLGISDNDIDMFMESDEVLQGKIKLARKARTYWRRISPRDTGEYRDSIKVTVDGNVSVGSDDEKANLIEYGTVDTPEFAPRAKTQAKFRLDDGD